MRINHNVAAMNTHRQMGINTSATQKSLEKLSSGLAINRAGDNAAGLAISEKMRGQIRGLDQASKNSQDGISMIQTGEGALNETQSILQRIRELAVQSGNDTNTATDRSNIQTEAGQLTQEVDRIAQTTEFNTKKLLDGTMGGAVTAAVANVQKSATLSAGAAIGGATKLSTLTDANGNKLGIVSTDTIIVSRTINGTVSTVTLHVSTTGTVAALTIGGTATTYSTNQIIMTASTAGFATAINGITVTVKDKTGALRGSATNALNSFTQTTQAANKQSDGSATFLIGANSSQTINLSIKQMDATALGVKNLDLSTQAAANVAIKAVDTALQLVSAQRGNLGAVQNRLEHTISNLDTSSENLQSSESRIRDVDMAKEMMNFTKNNILSQASQAMLAQANQQPQGVLSLLR